LIAYFGGVHSKAAMILRGWRMNGDRRWTVFALQFLLTIATTAIAVRGANATEHPAVTEAPASYEIAAQDLDVALNAYIRASGVQVFFETAIVAGRHSMPVNGRFTAAQALKTLLVGTGLTASRTDVDAFVITPSVEGGSDSSISTVLPDGRFMAALQAGVLAALCRDPRTRPGSYRIAIELWITPQGIVQQSSLIGSTGDAGRDEALRKNLQAASIAATPPPGSKQPFVMMIKRRDPRDTGDCAG
jgi:hypothetical protein